MLTDKKISLRPILESSKGIHLTAYLVHNGELNDLKCQLREILVEANEFLQPVLSISERKKFLEPLDSLLLDARIFKNMKGNIGLFRTQDSFRVLNVPVELERQCHVATSFHVKPLLKWLQVDQDFFFLTLEKKGAHLYLGSQSSFQKIDSIFFTDKLIRSFHSVDSVNLKSLRKINQSRDELISILVEWILEATRKSNAAFFMAGPSEILSPLAQNLKQNSIQSYSISETFHELDIPHLVIQIRKNLRDKAEKHLGLSLLEFQLAEEMDLAQKNIFRISKAAVKGLVKKLIIADEVQVFGKMDFSTGDLEINSFDMDHEDDDILDDLAQTVLAQGGEVVIAPQSEIPKNRFVLALVDPDLDDSNQRKELKSYEEVL